MLRIRNLFWIWVGIMLLDFALLAGAVWVICIIVKHFFH